MVSANSDSLGQWVPLLKMGLGSELPNTSRWTDCHWQPRDGKRPRGMDWARMARRRVPAVLFQKTARGVMPRTFAAGTRRPTGKKDAFLNIFAVRPVALIAVNSSSPPSPGKRYGYLGPGQFRNQIGGYLRGIGKGFVKQIGNQRQYLHGVLGTDHEFRVVGCQAGLPPVSQKALRRSPSPRNRW